MAQLVNFQVIELPKLYLVGKAIRYSMESHMQGDNRIPAFWAQCFKERMMDVLEKEKEKQFDSAQVGVMLDWARGDGDFSYVVGMLFTTSIPVPEGYVQHILAPTKAAVGWVKGKDTMDCCMAAHELTEKEAQAQGCQTDGMQWCMELYNCPRFTAPDEKGHIILDYYIPCKQ